MTAAASTVGVGMLRPDFPHGLQVLLVSSDAVERDALVEQLQTLSYKVEAFPNARDAAVFLSEGQRALDIVLAEAQSVHVGDTESQWLLSQARTRKLPLVLMSSGGSAGEVMKGIELGAVDYMEKPISLQKLRNIWQHVVRKLMASGTQPEQKAMTSIKLETAAPPAEKVGSGPSSPRQASPSPSSEHMQSTMTGHSSKCSEADASSQSCAETPLKACRGFRSVDPTSAESGKPATTDAATAPPPAKASNLSRASSSSRPSRSRKVREPRAPVAIKPAPPPPQQQQQQQQATPAAAEVTAMSTGSLPATSMSCGWSAPAWGMVPSTVSWQQMPATFMPVGDSPMASSGCGAVAAPPCSKGATGVTSLPSMGSFASAMSSSLELDIPFGASGSVDMTGASPSFCSDDSLHSDFTELMLPNDLDLDLMFGDGLGDGFCSDVLPPPLAADKPPIGLSLRKSQSFVNLINEHLAKAAAAGSAVEATTAAAPAATVAPTAVPQCA